MIQNYPDVRGRFEKPGSNAVPVVLLSPFMAEGTVVFHQDHGQSGGDFFPGKTKVSISEKTRCQLLLAKSRVLLNVTMFPPAPASEVEHFPFEIAAWEPLEQPRRNGRTDSPADLGDDEAFQSRGHCDPSDG